jgi:hypothetical protein
MKRPRRFRLAPPPGPTEKQVTEGCKAVMQRRGYRPLRLNSGLFWTVDGRRQPVGECGIPDLAGMHELYPGILVELKRPGGKTSPEQEAWMEETRIGYRLAMVVIDDAMALEEWLDAHEERTRKTWGATIAKRAPEWKGGSEVESR